MALTPEDVVNKRFQPTKFREGYDQDEVDDFLDEVVVELRRLNQENEELRQRLSASESRVAELQRGGQESTTQQEPAPAAVPAPAAAAPVAAAPASTDTGVDAETANTNNLLQLARRLHEEHVREGMEKRDALIAEGHATAARVVAEAESKQRAELANLDREKEAVERRIEELRNFERDYRQTLKTYIQDQLNELESSASSGSSPAVQRGGLSASSAGGAGASEGAATPFGGFGG